MTNFERLKKAKAREQCFDVLFEFETEIRHAILSGKGLSIQEWLSKEHNPKETIAKATAQAIYYASRKGKKDE